MVYDSLHALQPGRQQWQFSTCDSEVLYSNSELPKHRLWGLITHLPSGFSHYKHFLALQVRAKGTGSFTQFHLVCTLALWVSLLAFLLPIHWAFMPQGSRDGTHLPSFPCAGWHCSFALPSGPVIRPKTEVCWARHQETWVPALPLAQGHAPEGFPSLGTWVLPAVESFAGPLLHQWAQILNGD